MKLNTVLQNLYKAVFRFNLQQTTQKDDCMKAPSNVCCYDMLWYK